MDRNRSPVNWTGPGRGPSGPRRLGRWLASRWRTLSHRRKLVVLAGLIVGLVSLAFVERLTMPPGPRPIGWETPSIDWGKLPADWGVSDDRGVEAPAPGGARTGTEGEPTVTASAPTAPPTNSVPSAGQLKPPAAAAPPPAAEATGTKAAMRRPMPGPVSRGYGWTVTPRGEYRFHTGADIDAPEGTRVLAAWAGTVVKVEVTAEAGLAVTLEHSDKKRTLYGNLASTLVRQGEVVTRGQPVGTVGTSFDLESAQPPHLHFEFLDGGEAVEPPLR